MCVFKGVRVCLGVSVCACSKVCVHSVFKGVRVCEKTERLMEDTLIIVSLESWKRSHRSIASR